MLVVHLASEAKIIEIGVLSRNSYPKYLHSAYSCIKRVRVSNTGNVYAPACCFATSEPVDSPSSTSPSMFDVPDLPEEDSNEVSFSFISTHIIELETQVHKIVT